MPSSIKYVTYLPSVHSTLVDNRRKLEQVRKNLVTLIVCLQMLVPSYLGMIQNRQQFLSVPKFLSISTLFLSSKFVLTTKMPQKGIPVPVTVYITVSIYRIGTICLNLQI